jgi:hypothetical protein
MEQGSTDFATQFSGAKLHQRKTWRCLSPLVEATLFGVGAEFYFTTLSGIMRVVLILKYKVLSCSRSWIRFSLSTKRLHWWMKANTGDGTERGNDDEHRALHMVCKLEERSLASVQNIHVRYQTSDDYRILSCCAVQSRRNWPTFRRCLLSPSSGRSVMNFREISCTLEWVKYESNAQGPILEVPKHFNLAPPPLHPNKFK